MSGAFADTEATEAVEVPCPCPGTPHEKDTVSIRAQFSGGDVAVIDGALVKIIDADQGLVTHDFPAQTRTMMQLGVVGWTFTNGTSDAIPFNPRKVNDLSAPIWTVVAERLSEKLRESRLPLVAPSRKGSRPTRRSRS